MKNFCNDCRFATAATSVYISLQLEASSTTGTYLTSYTESANPAAATGTRCHTFLKAVHDLKDEHLLFIDAWDIICLRGPDELIARFESLGHPWLVAAEPNCWPDKNLASRHAPCDTQYRYLNSGGMMLRREYALKWASKVVTFTIYDGAYHYSDQYWWMLRHFENPDLFKLDTRCEMFQ